VLVDGHNRLSICRQFDLPYKTVQVWSDLHTLDDVKARIKLNAASQRNLTPSQCSKLRYEAVQHLMIGNKAARQAAQQVASQSGMALRTVQRDIEKGRAAAGLPEELQDSEVVWGMSPESVGKLAQLEPAMQEQVLEVSGHNSKRAATELKNLESVAGSPLYNAKKAKQQRKRTEARRRQDEAGLMVTATEQLGRAAKAIKSAQTGLGFKDGAWHKALHHLDSLDQLLNDWNNVIKERHRNETRAKDDGQGEFSVASGANQGVNESPRAESSSA
jgi:hypothetical protein